MYMSMLNDTVYDVLPTSVDIELHNKVGVSGTHLFNTPDPTITKAHERIYSRKGSWAPQVNLRLCCEIFAPQL